ncbi:hypothetical protein ACUODJ_51880, partial [Escherichia sp. HC-CC]
MIESIGHASTIAGYLVQTLLFNKAIPTDALMISSILGFMTIPFLGWLSDKIGHASTIAEVFI